MERLIKINDQYIKVSTIERKIAELYKKVLNANDNKTMVKYTKMICVLEEILKFRNTD